MRQRGRKSVEALAALAADDAPDVRLAPPRGLSRVERRLFLELISTARPGHFCASDTPLIVSFVQVSALLRKTIRDPGMAAASERAIKMQVLLARALRLTVRSRIDARELTRPQTPLRVPWAVDE